MKKSMAVLSAFMIGVNSFASGTVAMAEQNEGENTETNHSEGSHVQESLFWAAENGYDFGKESLELFGTEGKGFLNQTPTLPDLGKKKPIENSMPQEGKEDKIPEESVHDGKEPNETGLERNNSDENLLEDTEKEEIKEEGQKSTGMENLQIPQKFDVVIDPWEMDGKDQIYSQEYVIQNTGEKAGVLTLSHLTCKPKAQSGAVVKTDKAGLHDNEEKSVYMEMVFGNGDRIVLSEESSEYQVKLQPGEELSLCFTGETNEYAEDGWKNGDVSVGVVYSWEIIETVTSENTGDIEAIEDRDTNNMENESTDTSAEQQEEEAVLNEKEDESDVSDTLENDESGNDEEGLTEEMETDGDNQEIEEGDSKEEEETETIDLQKFGTSEMLIDSWNIDENGQIASGTYVVRNTGDREGTFKLSKLMCRPAEDSGLLVKREKEELNGEKGKEIYMEMVLGSGEKLVLTEKEADYQVGLQPGEELAVCFIGEISRSALESVKEEGIVVSASCFWDVLEMEDE